MAADLQQPSEKQMAMSPSQETANQQHKVAAESPPRKPGENNLRLEVQPDTNTAPLMADKFRFSEWPLSDFEKLRQNSNVSTTIPKNATSPIDCPACLSFLVGAAHGKRILLIGHQLYFTGAEVLLLNFARLLEESGAHVRMRFPFSRSKRSDPRFLKLHQGLSFLFAKQLKNKPLELNDFDFIFANTAAVEQRFNFFEKTSAFYTPSEMVRIYSKTMVLIHELDSNPHTGVAKVLANAGLVLFDSEAGRRHWADAYPQMANKTRTVMPGVFPKI